MVRHYRRKHLRHPGRRMEAAARLRAEGLSLRQIAVKLAVSYETIRRDLAKRGAAQASVSHLPVKKTPPGGQFVTPGCDSANPNVIPLRRTS
jgi:hypothetical protein